MEKVQSQNPSAKCEMQSQNPSAKCEVRSGYSTVWILRRFGALVFLWVVLGGIVQAQEGDYRTLWRQGAYVEAVEALEGRFENLSYRPRSMRQDYAELLVITGRIDEAIELLEGIAVGYDAPGVTVRLAELYRERGRLGDFNMALLKAEQQVRSLSDYRRDVDDLLAAARVRELKGEDPKSVLRFYNLMAEVFSRSAAVFVASGNLALQKRAFDVAAQKYGQALELNPENQDALAGLMWCYYHSSDPRAQEVMAQLATLNANHPSVRQLQAEKLLDRNEPSSAMTVLDSMLALNSHHTEALALKVAAFFLLGDSTAMQKTQEEALAFNGFFSGSFRIPGRIASRQYRFEEGRAFQERALVIDDKDVEARLLLAFDLLRLGEDAVARGELERVFIEDPYSVRAYNLLEAADAIDGFRTISRGIFKLQMPGYEAEVLADDLLALLNEAASLYQRKYNIELHTPVVVQVFDDHDVFMVRSVGLPGNVGHLGICFGRLVTMDSPRARPPGAMNWQQVLWHEFVHVITLQKTKNRMPRWLSEGISVYEETEKEASWGQRLSPDFKQIVDDDGFPGVHDLERLFTEPKTAMHLMFGYFASGEFVTFYVERYGIDALVTVLGGIGDGMLAVEALVSVSGVSLREIDERFGEYLANRCAPLKALAVDSQFRKALQAGETAVEAKNWEAAERFFLEAHQLYPDYASPDAPLHQLVDIGMKSGDSERHRKALEKLVEWDATAHEACLVLSQIYVKDKTWDAANETLDRAFAVNPFHVEMLVQRAQVHLASGDLDGAEADWRRLVFLDGPGRATHRLNLAKTLAEKGEKKAAKAEVLALLESVPHFWDAQQLLLQLVEAQ
jgi:tetratricopeptide (TPR) repeat protein